MGQRFIPSGKPSLKSGPRRVADDRVVPADIQVDDDNVTVAPVVEKATSPVETVEEKVETAAKVEETVVEAPVEEPKAAQPAETVKDTRKKRP